VRRRFLKTKDAFTLAIFAALSFGKNASDGRKRLPQTVLVSSSTTNSIDLIDGTAHLYVVQNKLK
jgi:hypothetical protein